MYLIVALVIKVWLLLLASFAHSFVPDLNQTATVSGQPSENIPEPRNLISYSIEHGSG